MPNKVEDACSLTYEEGHTQARGLSPLVCDWNTSWKKRTLMNQPGAWTLRNLSRRGAVYFRTLITDSPLGRGPVPRYEMNLTARLLHDMQASNNNIVRNQKHTWILGISAKSGKAKPNSQDQLTISCQYTLFLPSCISQRPHHRAHQRGQFRKTL